MSYKDKASKISQKYTDVTTSLSYVKTISFDEELPIVKTNNLYKFINNFGVITYRTNNTVKKIEIPLKEIKPKKTISENIYYIEVPSFLKEVDSMNLEFNIRNKMYTYVLK